ncbi:peroxide stress protein YaaA [Catenulispora subtropica]|uniref:Peroxide stress protein YaaA n=1 Tax=Catenulispora subtropica TaxID=450798 RepID=A0ABN2S2V4_9ACTN
MLILLPPSEGKAADGSGPAVDLAALAFPELAKPRKALMAELGRLAKGRAATALTVLGLSPNQAAELEANRDLATAPTLPAADRYTGVLYDALDLPGLRHDAPEAYARAEARVLTFSGLWGVVRPTDAIPAYRCSGGVTLPKAGSVAKLWRQALTPALAPVVANGLVVDLRSSAYAAMWRVPADVADRAATVRVLHERLVDGVPKRSVVSHFNKATKGRLARALLVGDVAADTPKELAVALQDLGFRTETAAPAKPGTAWTIDVVVDSVA